MKKTILLLLAAASFFSCQKEAKNDIAYMLTRDSIQYFDVYPAQSMKSPQNTFSFDVSGKNELYLFTPDGKNRNLITDIKTLEDLDKNNIWKEVNDSTFIILGQYPHVIERFSEDTIYVRSEKGQSNVMVRLKGKPAITEESLYRRDSIIDDMKRKERVEREYKVQAKPAAKQQ